MKIFERRLKTLREEKELAKTTVAKFLGIAEGTYRAYESGRSEPSQEMLVKIARYFGVSVSYLLGEEDI
ncbi:MAG: helix-turn-helix domain-containing protein [Firmicutes bacterium]|nr:helix-turn-helix domain-containing protein [Bacillota bacterium]